jgi:hypothetical protein
MKFVNRGYMSVKPTQKFLDWANTMDQEYPVTLEFCEGNIYLIEEDFMEVEPILKANFKAIFENEFTAITEEDDLWPCEFKLENFEQYFTVEFGTTVLDTQKSDLKRD